MGIFNDNSQNDHLGHVKLDGEKGRDGADGIGYKLTADGNFDIDGKRLTNIADPINNQDSTSKKYVDLQDALTKSVFNTQLNTKLNKLGGDINGTLDIYGELDMNNHKIIGVANPTADRHCANKKYVDDSAVDTSDFLLIDGSRAMAGDLYLNFNAFKNLKDPVDDKDACSKKYVDNKVVTVDDSKFLFVDGSKKNDWRLRHEQSESYKLSRTCC